MSSRPTVARRGRPKTPAAQRSIKFHISMRRPQYAALQALATELGITLSETVRRLIDNYRRGTL